MKRKKGAFGALFAMFLAGAASAEYQIYGEVDLTGLARESWGLSSIALLDAMVCNVNGPDGFLTVRSGPGTSFGKVRAFNRLAILTVDISQRRGNWVYIVDGYRTVTKDGRSQQIKNLPVQGWAHDGYLCDFIH
ncbi:MAG: hypothetical protein ABJL67_23365 [Sulfitobacter sp.]